MRFRQCVVFLLGMWVMVSAQAIDSCKAILLKQPNLSHDLVNSLTPLDKPFLKKYGYVLFYNPSTPVLGEAKAKVTVVDFFDYQCSYCKKFSPLFKSMIQANPNLRVVYKELPIFGHESELATMSALTANKMGKYSEFHERLLGMDSLSEAKISALRSELGVSHDAMEINHRVNAQEISDSMRLMDALHIVGTPSFVLARIEKSDLEKARYQMVKAYFVTNAATTDEMAALVKAFSAHCA